MEAGTVHCPCCGAGISSDSTQCQYCHSLLQTVACPSCFGLMFVGSKFCLHCGAAAASPVVEATPPTRVIAMPCPRCVNEQMQPVDLSGVRFDECQHCGGIWLDNETFIKICADRESQEATVDIHLPPPPHEQLGQRYLKCPVCTNLMNRWNFAERSGIVIEKCRLHGVWTDRDQLRQIIEFIRAGGLALAREREIEELQRQRIALQAAEADANRSRLVDYLRDVS